MRTLSTEIDGLDQRAASRFGISRTDLRCIDVLRTTGPLTASELARAVGLTSGGLSIALERLEHSGFIRRRSHPDDRRKVLVETTSHVKPLEAEVFGALGKRMSAILQRYDDDELRLIEDYLERTATAIVQTATDSQR